MTWFAVDDSFHSHTKLAELEAGGRLAESVSLWTLAGSWSASQLTDGFIPSAQLRKLVPFHASKAAAELVRVGLWLIAEGGYQFRDWNHYQPTRAEVEAKRASSVARTRKSREIAKQRSCNALHAPNVTHDVTRELRSPVPSRPVPDTLLAESTRAEPSKSMSAFTASFGPPPDDRLAHIAKRYSDARHAAGHGRWTWDKRNHGWQFDTLKAIDAAIQAETDMTADEALDRALAAFFQDEDARPDKFKLSWLATGFGGYVAAGTEAPPTKHNAAEIATLKAEYYATRKAEEESRNQGVPAKAETIRLRDHGNALARRIRALEAAE